MNPQLARDIAHIAAAECVEPLRKAIASDKLTTARRMLIEKIRDRLHAACRLFEHSSLAEDAEEHYLPLFDALSAITDGLRVKQLLYERLRMGLGFLESIQGKGGRP